MLVIRIPSLLTQCLYLQFIHGGMQEAISWTNYYALDTLVDKWEQ